MRQDYIASGPPLSSAPSLPLDILAQSNAPLKTLHSNRIVHTKYTAIQREQADQNEKVSADERIVLRKLKEAGLLRDGVMNMKARSISSL